MEGKAGEFRVEGHDQKDDDSKAADKRRVKDLKTLKESGGPFTSVDEVNAYLENDSITEEEKGKRMYVEVRYCRDTTVSLPKKSDLFRLQEKHKPLPVGRLAANLKTYLGKISTNASANWEDFDNAASCIPSKLS